jgi:hypothetical protein
MNEKELITENGRITSTMLGYEDHGILTIMLHVEMDGSGIGYGGYSLDEYDKKQEKRMGTAYGLDCIIGILKTLDIDKWEKIPGTYIRIEHEGWGGKATRIGHVIKDQWFDFRVKRDSDIKLRS